MRNEKGFTVVPYCPIDNPDVFREAPTPSGWDSDYWVREDGRVINYYGCGGEPPPGQVLYQPGWATTFGWPEITNQWASMLEGRTDKDGLPGDWRLKYLLTFMNGGFLGPLVWVGETIKRMDHVPYFCRPSKAAWG